MLEWLNLPPEPTLPAPNDAELLHALRISRPDLEGTSYRALDEGWAFRAYLAGDCVLRFP